MVAVYGSTAGENNPIHRAYVAAGFQQGYGSADIDIIVLAWIEDGSWNTDPGRQMIDYIHALQKRPEFGDIAHITAIEIDAPL